MKTSRILTTLLASVPMSVFAHSGHHEGLTLIHFLSSPFHMIPTFIILTAFGIFLAWKFKKVKN